MKDEEAGLFDQRFRLSYLPFTFYFLLFTFGLPAAAAASAAAVVTTTAATTATAPEATALFTRPCFVHDDVPTVILGAVELCDGVVGIILTRHLDKPKTAGAARLAIKNNIR